MWNESHSCQWLNTWTKTIPLRQNKLANNNLKYQYHKTKTATQVLLWMQAPSSLVFCDYEILMFPQQNLAWLKFSFGKVFYYGNERICLPAVVLSLPEPSILHTVCKASCRIQTTAGVLTTHSLTSPGEPRWHNFNENCYSYNSWQYYT